MTDYRNIPTSMLPLFYYQMKRNIEEGPGTVTRNELLALKKEAKKRGVFFHPKANN